MCVVKPFFLKVAKLIIVKINITEKFVGVVILISNSHIEIS